MPRARDRRLSRSRRGAQLLAVGSRRSGVTSTLEFFDAREQLTDIMDVFGFLELYTSYCAAQGIAVNEKLILG